MQSYNLPNTGPILNYLKPDTRLNNTNKLGLLLTVNTLHLHYKYQVFKAIQGKGGSFF